MLIERMRNRFLASLYCNADGGGADGGADNGGGGADKGAAGGADKGAGGGADKGAAGSGEKFTGPFYEDPGLGFDDKIKAHFAGKNFPDIKTALLSGVEADALARSRNVLPKPDPAKLADWEGHEMLGWVKDPEKYIIGVPKSLAERKDIVIDKSLQDVVRKSAHELRVPLPAAQGLFDKIYEHFTLLADTQKSKGAKDLSDTQAALDEKWGQDRERNIELARRAMETFGIGVDDTGEIEKLIGAPRVLQTFFAIAEKIGEAGLKKPGENRSGLPQSVAAIRSELNRLEADREWMAALNNNRHARHKDVTAERERLITRMAEAQSREKSAA